MNKNIKTIIFTIFALLFVNFHAQAKEAAQNPSQNFTDRLYMNYETSEQNWKNIPRLTLFGKLDGSPYIIFNPEAVTLQHSGYVGIKMGDGWFPFFGSKNSRFEFGGSSEKGSDKQQLNIPLIPDGPFTGYLISAPLSETDVSGLLTSRNSLTFKRSEREYFFNYKADYYASCGITITPLIGFDYKRLNQNYGVYLYTPEFDTERNVFESINSKSVGIYVGLVMQKPLPLDLNLVLSGKIGLNHQWNRLEGSDWDPAADRRDSFSTHDIEQSYDASFEVGVQKKIYNFISAFSYGMEVNSYMPEIINPRRSNTDPTVYLDGRSAYNWHVKVSFTYNFS